MSFRSRFTDRSIVIVVMFAAGVLVVAALFPHAHVVYADAHDDGTCPLMALVLAGALMLPALAALILLLRPMATRKPGWTVPVFNPVVLPFSSRAPPVS